MAVFYSRVMCLDIFAFIERSADDRQDTKGVKRKRRQEAKGQGGTRTVAFVKKVPGPPAPM